MMMTIDNDDDWLHGMMEGHLKLHLKRTSRKNCKNQIYWKNRGQKIQVKFLSIYIL